MMSLSLMNSYDPLAPEIIGRKIFLHKNMLKPSYRKGTVSSSLKSKPQEDILTGHQTHQPFYTGIAKAKHLNPAVHRTQNPPYSSLRTNKKAEPKVVNFALNNPVDKLASLTSKSKESEREALRQNMGQNSDSYNEISPPLVQQAKRAIRRITTTLPSTSQDANEASGNTKVKVITPLNSRRTRKKIGVKKKKRLTRKKVKKPKKVKVACGLKNDVSRLEVRAKSESNTEKKESETKATVKPPYRSRVIKQTTQRVNSVTGKLKKNSAGTKSTKGSLKVGARVSKASVKNKGIQINLDQLPRLFHKTSDKTVHFPMHVKRVENDVKQSNDGRNVSATRKLSGAGGYDKVVDNISTMTSQQGALDSSGGVEQNPATTTRSDRGSDDSQSKKSKEAMYLEEVRAKLAKTKGKVAIVPSNISVVSHKTRSTESVFKQLRLSQTRQQLGLSPLVTAEEAVLLNAENIPDTTKQLPRKSVTIKSGAGHGRKKGTKSSPLLLATQLKAILASYDTHKRKFPTQQVSSGKKKAEKGSTFLTKSKQSIETRESTLVDD